MSRVCTCRVASRASLDINCQSLALAWQVEVNLLGSYWLSPSAMKWAAASRHDCSGITSSFSHNIGRMRIIWPHIKLDDDAHVAQIALLYVAVFFHTLAVFQPSVRDIDVSRRKLQGAGWRNGVRVRRYLWDIVIRIFSSLLQNEPGATERETCGLMRACSFSVWWTEAFTPLSS